jgi:hypothetical protein
MSSSSTRGPTPPPLAPDPRIGGRQGSDHVRRTSTGIGWDEDRATERQTIEDTGRCSVRTGHVSSTPILASVRNLDRAGAPAGCELVILQLDSRTGIVYECRALTHYVHSLHRRHPSVE